MNSLSILAHNQIIEFESHKIKKPQQITVVVYSNIKQYIYFGTATGATLVCSRSSTSKIRFVFGGITPPAPRSP